MQTITIAEKLWLEPTLLGVTLNYTDTQSGRHYRVGIGFRSLMECEQALAQDRVEWHLKDHSLLIEGQEELTLTFCPSTPIAIRVVLNGEPLETFRSAIAFLGLASECRNN